MTILIAFQFGSFRNFKHYYLFYIRQHLRSYFPDAVFYNRFVELESRVFFQMMFFLNLSAFGKCSGISFVDHQRHAQEHRTARALKAQVCQQLHHEHGCDIGCILLL